MNCWKNEMLPGCWSNIKLLKVFKCLFSTFVPILSGLVAVYGPALVHRPHLESLDSKTLKSIIIKRLYCNAKTFKKITIINHLKTQ